MYGSGGLWMVANFIFALASACLDAHSNNRSLLARSCLASSAKSTIGVTMFDSLCP